MKSDLPVEFVHAPNPEKLRVFLKELIQRAQQHQQHKAMQHLGGSTSLRHKTQSPARAEGNEAA